MVHFFCRRCQRPSPHPTCEGCGKPIPVSSVCNVWEEVALPVADPVKIGFVIRVMLFVTALLFIVMLAVEFIFNTSGENAISVFLTKSGFLPLLVEVFLLGTAAGLALLALQGRETAQYLMEGKGILKRTWIQPTRLKCWARLLKYDKAAIRENAEGVPFMMAHEEYLTYQDVARYSISPRTGRVKLYRPYAFLFMSLHIPAADFDPAANMLAAKLKNKASR